MDSSLRFVHRLALVGALGASAVAGASGQAPPPVVVPQVQIPQIPQQPPQLQIPQISPADTLKIPQIPNLPAAVAAEITAQPQRVVPAAQQLYIAAAPETAIVPITATIQAWRTDAATQLNCIQSNGFQLAFEGLWTILSYDGSRAGATTNAEDLSREARACFLQYAEDLKKINEYSEGPAVAQGSYDTMVENLRVDWRGQVANYIPRRVDDGRNYRRSPSQEAPAAAPTTPSCHTEENYVTEKVPVRAGFDAQGNPYYKMDWDVVKRTRTVCD